MTALTLICEERKTSGTSNAKFLRKQGKLPAIIYEPNNNMMISLSSKDFTNQHYKKNLLSKVLHLELNGKTLKAIPRDIQLDPLSGKPIHIDLQLVKDDTLVNVNINTKIINPHKSPGIKKGGILNVIKRHIRCNCISNHIPDHIEIDVTGYDIGKNVHINDIKLPKGTTVIDQANFTVLTIRGRLEEGNDIKEDTENKEDKNHDIKIK